MLALREQNLLGEVFEFAKGLHTVDLSGFHGGKSPYHFQGSFCPPLSPLYLLQPSLYLTVFLSFMLLHGALQFSFRFTSF